MSIQETIIKHYEPVCDTCGAALGQQALNLDAAVKFAQSHGWQLSDDGHLKCRRCQILEKEHA